MRICSVFLLAMLSAAAASGEVAGTWEGDISFPNGVQHVIFHVTGSDSALKATWDNPKLNHWGYPVPQVLLKGPTFSLGLVSGASFSGDLTPDGTINGTWTERGMGFPLVLSRGGGTSRPAPVATGSVTNGRYHNDYTGIEFNLPEGFSLLTTDPYMNNDGVQAMFRVSLAQGKLSVGAWMDKNTLQQKNLAAVLDMQIQAKIKRRNGPDNGYTVPPDTIQKLTINGQQAIKATAFLQQNGEKQVELLTWIVTTHSVVHFYALVPADRLPDFEWRFSQMVQSASVP